MYDLELLEQAMIKEAAAAELLDEAEQLKIAARKLHPALAIGAIPAGFGALTGAVAGATAPQLAERLVARIPLLRRIGAANRLRAALAMAILGGLAFPPLAAMTYGVTRGIDRLFKRSSLDDFDDVLAELGIY
jgi:hypothetical protein